MTLTLLAAAFLSVAQPAVHKGRLPVLGCQPETSIIEADGLKFKDLDRNGVLTPYED